MISRYPAEGSSHFCRDIPGRMRLMGHVRSSLPGSPFDSGLCCPASAGVGRLPLLHPRDLRRPPPRQARRLPRRRPGRCGPRRPGLASVHAIGAAYAALAGTQTRHGIKQANRPLGNVAFDVERLQKPYVLHVLGQRTEALLSLDWTDFEADDQTTLVLMLATTHGRSTPLLWGTTTKSELAGRRTALERDLVQRFHELVPS